MKLSKSLTLLISLFILSSCGGTTPAPTPITSGGESTDLTDSGSGTSEEQKEINESFDFTILSSNDIHGQIDPEDQYVDGGRAGIVKYLTYAKHLKDTEPNTFLFDVGDTFQGNLYSNHNRGKLITDLMNYVHYDAKCLGNHDFDWGLEPLRENKPREYNGYSTPTLCANVYDYDFTNKRFGTTHQDDLADSTVTYTLDNGFKIGVIGSIGSDQITSICTTYVKDIGFVDYVQTIKQEATKLREAGCHFIIDLHHGSVTELAEKGLNQYIDLGLCGHTHKKERYLEGNARYYQFADYTRLLGKIVFHFDKNTQKVTCKKDNDFIISPTMWNSGITDDPTIANIVNQYKTQADNEIDGQEILANNVKGYFDDYYRGPNLMAKAIYDTAKKEGYEIDFSYCNQLRHSLTSEEWTFADIYQAAPFDNVIYIYDVTYDEMMNEVMNWNNICKEPGKIIKLEEGKTYKMASIDFPLLHTNADRYFDFFPSLNNRFYTEFNTFPKLSKTYRDVLKSWLIDNGYNSAKELKADDFDSDVSGFDKNEFQGPTYKVTLHMNDGTSEDDVIGIVEIPTNHNVFDSDLVTEPTRADFNFIGWYLDREGNYEQYFSYGSRVTSDMDLYARWSPKSHDFYRLSITKDDFVSDETSHTFYAINDYLETITVTSNFDKLGSNESFINMPGDGIMNFKIQSGYVCQTIEVYQFRYMNIEIYDGLTVDASKKVEAEHTDWGDTQFLYANKYDPGFTELTLHNTYTSFINVERINLYIYKTV